MPFVIVQLANYDGRQQTGNPRPIMPEINPVNSNWARLREAQRLVAKHDARAELAVINDLGETVDIHPLRKKEVAERVGLCFDRLIYNNKVKLSPEVVTSVEQGDKAVLILDQPVQSGPVYEFELSDDDGRFVNVEAVAEDHRITIRSPFTSHLLPLTLRYAWKDNPTRANVRSLTGLPMSSFEMKIGDLRMEIVE